MVHEFGVNQTEASLLSIVIRLAAAAFLGGIIGFEREISRQSSGFRTHMLVATAAALFTILAFEIFYYFDNVSGGDAQLDAIRVVEAVTAGVAFLAAGSIIRSGKGVKGLTTGAAMWMAGAVGVACGAGFMVVAAIGTVLAVTITFGFKFVETHWLKRPDTAERE